MHDARVLVVDDSAAMRALFCDILDGSKSVTVVGTAASAAEARDQIKTLKPNVLTLDVEMPGLSGIDFLEEIMTTNPMPVVMLSGLTQSGTETSLKAFELGAVECFPKPLKMTPEQFSKSVAKLGKIVLTAANSNVRSGPRNVRRSAAHFEWNGHLVALSASMGGVDALSDLLAIWPQNCPPTIIVLNTEPAVAAAFVARLNQTLPCSVREAKDGAALTAGIVHIASDPEAHVIVEPGSPPRLRVIAREPVDGARPSANLLFGSLARAGAVAVGAVLTGVGEDGAKGLKLLREAGCHTFAQLRQEATVPQAPAAAIAASAVEAELPVAEIGAEIIACCSAA